VSLSIKQVRYFIAAADFGQVSLAALELNVSQSAVTAAVQQLEASLGEKLFVRSPTGVSLTAQGSRFLQHARNIMAVVNEALVSPLSEDNSLQGTVAVGMSYTVAGYFMPRHHARFARTYPRIHLDMREMQREDIEDGLLTGRIDAAVMLVSNLTDRSNIAYETLLRSRRRLWVPPEHSLLEASSISLEDVAKEPYVMLTVDEADQTAGKYWDDTGLCPKVIFDTSSVEAVRSMVAAGMGVTILSDMVYRPWSLEGQRLETRNVDADIPTMDVGIAWSRERHPSPAARTFIDFLSRAFGSSSYDDHVGGSSRK
jgi:DNA-binding transcriptional LysR family regulator